MKLTIHALRRISTAVAIWTAVALLVGGCATRREVQAIVAESNAAMLAAQIGDGTLSADPAASSAGGDWQQASRKIDEFIAAHPDQETAASALRIRQAILLLSNRQFEQARSAFAAARKLNTDRDKALKALSEDIIWWWQHSTVPTLNAAQRDRARGAMEAFDKEVAKLANSADIRDFLAEMRARVALKRVASLQIAEGKKEALADVINQYSKIFTGDDIAALRGGSLTPQSPAISTVEKRRLRALDVIQKAREPANVLRDRGQPIAVADLDEPARGFGALVIE